MPTVICLIVTPLIGALTDRMSKKRHMMTILLLFMAACCLVVKKAMNNYPLLLLCITGYQVGYNAINAVFTTISMEYAAEVGKPYGTVRLCGTLGYQIGELLVGYVLSFSLKSLYPMMAVGLLGSAGISLLMPNCKGYQHKKKRVPFTILLKDRRFLMLYAMILLPGLCNSFYSTFFTKHLGDLGMTNTTISWITMLSTVLEIPFLIFGDRLSPKTGVWNFVLLGMVLSGLQLIGLAFFRTFLPIVLVQQLSVSVMAFNEFMPSLYLTKYLPPELLSTGQSIKMMVTFGIGRIAGSMLGGVIADAIGIPSSFLIFGCSLLAAAAAFYIPSRKMLLADKLNDEAHIPANNP